MNLIPSYSLDASALVSTFSTSAKLSGTILASPDFIFAFSPQTFNSRALPRPSTTILLYHSLKPPSLRWADITTRPDGDELPTFHSDYCLFFFKHPNGEQAIASSKKPILSVNIRQPDLYVDENLAVHGIDGVLDPSTADKCSTVSVSDPTARIQAWVHRAFLDRAMRVLRKRGFHVASTALALLRPDLLTLPVVTVFAPSDKVLFSNPDGFRYDARRHIVPGRLRFDRLTSFTDGTEFETLAPNKTIFIASANDVVTVNGVRIDGAELYQNRWVVLYSIEPMTLDDAAGDTWRWGGSLSEITGNISNYSSTGNFGSGVPPAAPESFLGQRENEHPGFSPASGQQYVEDVISELFISPSQSPSQLPQCDVGLGVPVGVDSSGAFCSVIDDELNIPEDQEIQNALDVAQSHPLDGVAQSRISKRLLQSDPLISDDKGKGDPDSTNMAADLFYYI